MTALGDVVIVGGGCYGTFYTGQLERARASGSLGYRRLLVVDRDPACQVTTLAPAPGRELVVAEWHAFLDRWLAAPERDANGLPDTIVPTPLMPHLLASWLERKARAAGAGRTVDLVPVVEALGTVYDVLHPTGVRYVSHADWLCPTHCVEPGRCPATRAPRTWEMGETVAEWTARRNRTAPTAGPVLFTCRHLAYGVGMYPARLAAEALDVLAGLLAAPGGGELAVGSVSACHGALALLRVGPRVG